jgi:integrase
MINHIFKPKGSRIWRWKFRLRPEDKKIQDVSLSTSDKQAAESKRSKLLCEKEHERAGLAPSKAACKAAQCKLAEHLEDFLGDLRAKGRNGHYIKGIAFCLGQLIDQCGWNFPPDITADSFVKWRSSQNKAAKTLREYLISAKNFCNWLTAQGKIAANPLASVRNVELRGREVRCRRAYDDSEFGALLAAAGAQRMVYLTAGLTGIRHGELKELRWGDINLADEKPSVTVRASVSKNHKLACLPLHAALVGELKAFRPADAVAGDLVFKGLVPRSKVFNGHLKAAKIAKVDSQGRVVDFHSLRHTFCTNLHRAGVPQREAMELMRHNDPRLTATTYTDASLLSLRSAVQKLGFPASQIASQKLGAEGQSLTLPVNSSAKANSIETIENKGGKSLSDVAWRILAKIERWCALQALSLRTTRLKSRGYSQCETALVQIKSARGASRSSRGMVGVTFQAQPFAQGG